MLQTRTPATCKPNICQEVTGSLQFKCTTHEFKLCMFYKNLNSQLKVQISFQNKIHHIRLYFKTEQPVIYKLNFVHEATHSILRHLNLWTDIVTQKSCAQIKIAHKHQTPTHNHVK